MEKLIILFFVLISNLGFTQGSHPVTWTAKSNTSSNGGTISKAYASGGWNVGSLHGTAQLVGSTSKYLMANPFFF